MDKVNAFQFLLSTKVIFGENKMHALIDELKTMKATKPMIITDKGLIQAGLLDGVIKDIEKAGIDYYMYDDVIANPTINSVDRAAKRCQEEHCDLLLAVGGGSVMDTTKGIAVVATHDGSAYDYLDGRGEQKKEIIHEPLPIIAIPTTAGTGSEVSFYSVLTDETTKIKDSISSHKIYPRTAIIDPVLTANLPSYITACTGMDVLGHALEAYTSTIDNTMTDLFALEAIRLVFKHLPDAVNTGDMDARNNMAYASMLAGVAMSHCGATIPHALACPLTGHTGMPHGLAVGLLQIPMLAFNGHVLEDKIKYILHNLHMDADEINEGASYTYLIQMIKKLVKGIHLEEGLEKYIMDDQVIEAMTEDAYIHGCRMINPREVSKEDIKKIYREFITYQD
ncbi:iron-containing alcohol dehydrogenase [Vallitalea pronyensis]|uniref:Iron-containing alcohol dehydrogenase n=1 Tax=Vallitalea pronyensis TaxID=1348613 RepID=A0A8J8MK83_9FIRM|nr:iron-containing alcohol dehydrogenase [Vallitalea pronyensis]QUI22981.1 iron-containing alcohol dehydrogenase [Vallitalea pronyensis]